MTKIIKLSVVAAAISVLTACGNGADSTKPVALETETDKQSYALGASMGRYLSDNLEKNAEIGVQLDQAKLLAGIKDALAKKTQMTDEELQTVMQEFDTKTRKLQAEKQKELAVAELAKGKKFLAENAKNEGVVTTDSGLQYQVITAGEGEKPAAEDTVKVHYKGTLLDGTEFDSSFKRGEPASFPLNRVIKGWTEGVQHMSKGAKFKFFIPSELAYGERSSGKIPANSTLIFEVELLEITKAG